MLNSVLCGLFVLCLIAWGVSFPIKDEMRLRQLQRENQKLEPAIEALRREENQMQQLRKEVGSLTDFSSAAARSSVSSTNCQKWCRTTPIFPICATAPVCSKCKAMPRTLQR